MKFYYQKKNSKNHLKSLFILKGIFVLFIFFYSGYINSQCTNAPYGLHPANNFTTNCNGALEIITDIAYAGEYSNVVIFPNVQYTFASSRSFDYVTITNDDGTIIHASGITPISWNSTSNTGIIRYYLHHDSACQISNTDRTKYIACTSAQTLCYQPQNLGFAGITSTNASFYWDPVSPTPSQGYQYYISTSNVPPIATTNPTGSTNGINTPLSGLSANTTYYCWVRTSCNLTTQSNWIGSSFTTTGGCTTAENGLFPAATYTPFCTGNDEIIVTNAYAGEYSNINIISNKEYTFRSSVSNDFITITNANASTVYASGTSPLVWLSGSNSGVLRYYIHLNSNCVNQSVNRTRYIKCSSSNINCTAPANKSVNTITSEQATIMWDPATPLPQNGYLYYYSTINTPPTIFSTPITATYNLTNTISGLSSNTTYYWWVRSDCASSTSSWSSGPSFTTLTTPTCSSPTALNTSLVTNYSANIGWNAPSPIPNEGYNYYISTSSSPPNISTTPTGTTTNTNVQINGLTATTNYYFWVQSVCSISNRSPWVLVNFTTPNMPSGCTDAYYGQNPMSTVYYPLCEGTEEVITTFAKASSYSEVSVLSNTQYVFRSTANSDFLTITNEDGTVIYASGNTPLVWNSSSNVEIIRFYNHLDASCGSQNLERTKTVICGTNLSNQELEEINFIVYPNPVKNKLNIQTKKLEKFEYVIYTIDGKTVKKGKSNLEQTSIDLAELPSGMYLIEIYSDSDQKAIYKLIKK